MNGDGYLIARNIEVAAWTELFDSAPAGLRLRLGLSVSFMANAVVLSAAGIAHPLLNRAFIRATDRDALETVVAHYRRLGVQCFLIHRRHSNDNDSAVHQSAGLTVYRRRWVKLAGTPRRVSVPGPDELVIEHARKHNAAICGQIYCRGFDLPLSAAGVFAKALELPAWRVLVARAADGTVAGVGLLFVRQGVGYLAGGVTVPGFRGRGIQRALLARRITLATELGCRWITSETGEDAPGDPQHSLHNMRDLGLEIVGVTENLAAEETRWDHGVTGAAPA